MVVSIYVGEGASRVAVERVASYWAARSAQEGKLNSN